MSEDFPYEIFEPSGSSEAYLQLEDGLLDLFDENSTTTSLGIAEAVWLWETGVNYLHYDENLENGEKYLEATEDTVIERSITLSTEGGTLSASDLRLQIQTTYEDIGIQLDAGLAHASTDVRFIEEGTGTISLKVASGYYARVYSHIPSANIPSATMAKMAGQPYGCGGYPNVGRPCKDAQQRIKGTLPMHTTATSVVEFSTYLHRPIERYIDGEYLPGATDPLYQGQGNPPVADHTYELSSTECLSITHQNDYAKAIRDQIVAVAGGNFNKVPYLFIDDGFQPIAMSCKWSYIVYLANDLPAIANHERLTADVLFY